MSCSGGKVGPLKQDRVEQSRAVQGGAGRMHAPLRQSVVNLFCLLCLLSPFLLVHCSSPVSGSGRERERDFISEYNVLVFLVNY